MSKSTSKKKNIPKENLLRDAFRKLVEKRKSDVLEALQLYGDLPDCNAESACAYDWIHILLEEFSTVAEIARLDDSEAYTTKRLRAALARIVAACEAWDAAILKESRRK